MAETLDTRDWQAGVDPDLVGRLQRPLRRSAANACAWARDALARAQLGKLPMFAGWLARWGMNEAALAGLRPVVHAIASERAAGEAPRVPTAAGRVVPEADRAAIVAVARQAAPQREAATEGEARRATRREATGEARRATRREATGEASGELRRGVASEAGGKLAEPVIAARSEAPATLDLRVDPALLVAPIAAPTVPPTVPPIVGSRPAEASGLPARPRTRPRLVTPMDLAREQEGAAIVAARSAARVREGAADLRDEAQPAIVAATIEEPAVAASVVAATPSAAPGRGETTSVAPGRGETTGAAPILVEAPVVSPTTTTAAIVHAHAAATSVSSVRETPAARADAPRRVRARVLASSVEPVLMDSPQRAAATRPRVSVPAPTQPAVSLTGLTGHAGVAGVTGVAPAQADGSRMDLGLPSAVASQVAPQVAAAAPPAAPQQRPVPARVETSQLDIPAIAQAVHRHLERELRWERERRGGRS